MGKTSSVAVACAIRNRGTLQGVYGVNNPVVQKATTRVRAKALRAWQASARKDIVKGCRYFGCHGVHHRNKLDRAVMHKIDRTVAHVCDYRGTVGEVCGRKR